MTQQDFMESFCWHLHDRVRNNYLMSLSIECLLVQSEHINELNEWPSMNTKRYPWHSVLIGIKLLNSFKPDSRKS